MKIYCYTNNRFKTTLKSNRIVKRNIGILYSKLRITLKFLGLETFILLV